MSRFTARGGKPERLARLPAPYWQSRGGTIPPSVRMGSRWKALPVEGSKAAARRRPILSRILSR